MSFIQNDAVPLDLVQWGLLLDDQAFAFETAMLLAERAFGDSVGGENLEAGRQRMSYPTNIWYSQHRTS